MIVSNPLCLLPGVVRAAEDAPRPWGPSPDLLIGEVVTGGVSASDEWVEIHDHGSLAADLGGLELVYVTATGGTVTRKMTWQQQVIRAGGGLLLANQAGAFASLADGTWSGGLASAGGTLVLRVVNGDIVDTLSWGSAASAWVEGGAGQAPPAGASLERLPDGDDLNGRDTNDNRSDTWIQPQPIPDARHAAPTPTPEPTERPTPEPTERPTPEPTERPTPEPTERPTPEPTERPTPEPTERPTPEPTERPTPEPTERPTPEPTERPTPEPTERPTPEPTERPTPEPTERPTPEPTERPTPEPTDRTTPEPTPVSLTIQAARQTPSGTAVTVLGVLTTPLAFTESGRGAFLQDRSAGIGLYLSSSAWPAIPMGHEVRVSGVVTSRYGQMTISLTSANDIVDRGPSDMPAPVLLSNVPSESLEGQLVTVIGTVTGSPDELADGWAVDLVGDAGSYRVLAATGSGIDRASLVSGSPVLVTGVMGQHASTSAGTNGYRVWPRSREDIQDQPGASANPTRSTAPAPTSAAATPTPTPHATPTSRPTATPRPTASPRPTTSPRPTATPVVTPVVSIAAARGMTIGTRIAVEGTVTAVPGRLLRPGVTFLQDGTGGIAVELPSGSDIPGIKPGAIIGLAGRLTDPYANLELRAERASDLTVIGRGGVPDPETLTTTDLTESHEGRLVRVQGIIERLETGSSGSLAISIRDNGGEARVFLFGALAASRDRFRVGSRVTATGIVGQRESSSGAGDGYRVWPRDMTDLVIAAPAPSTRPGPAQTPRPTDGQRPQPSASASVVRISAVRDGQTVSVRGVVTAPGGLLDGEGRRVTIQDSSGAILLRLPDGSSVPHVGTRVQATGEVGSWYGGLQLAAGGSPGTLGRSVAAPVVLRHAPGAADEWRLVRLTVRITDVSRSGDTWRAEASMGAGGSLPIAGVTGSHIPSTAIAEGRSATVTGIVKRAYPTASDQRFAVVPRTISDIDLGRDPTGAGHPAESPGVDGDAGLDAAGNPGVNAGPDGAILDTRLDGLVGLAGHHVRVSGALRHIDSPLLTIDDGSASAMVRLLDGETTFQPPLAPGEVLNVTGVVAERDVGGWEVVSRSEAIVRAAALALPALEPSAPAGIANPSFGTTTPSDVATPQASSAGEALRIALILVLGMTAAGMAMVGGVYARRAGGWKRRSVGPGRRPSTPSDRGPDAFRSP